VKPVPASIVGSPPKRVVIKLGTGVLTSGIGLLDIERINAVCAQITDLRAAGTQVIVVSSGAVGLGMGLLGLKRRPRLLSQKQACAAVGQSLLMQTWQSGFEPHNSRVAQVLLTHEDVRTRSRHLAVKASFEAMLGYDTIPVVNENDTVSAAEIQFGDNDTLSAMLASLLHADYLLILSTAPGLIDMKGTGKIVPVVKRITPAIEAMAGGTTSATAVGGMISKISAARLATKAGCGVFIANGRANDVIPRIFSGHNPGTFFAPSGITLDARKHWIAYFQRPEGQVDINAHAVPALREQGGSLLAVGVTGCRGLFAAGEIIDICAPDGTVVARGKACFSSVDVHRIIGLNTIDIKKVFPYRRRLEVVHRDHLVLI